MSQNRSQYSVQLRVVKPGPGSRIHRNVITGVAGQEWLTGALLTQTNDGRADTVPPPITATITVPVRYIALSGFDGSANTRVAVQEIDANTVLCAQIKSGTATAANIGKRGVLVRDTTTGNYAVEITNSNPSLEIVDVEPNFAPYAPKAQGQYNLVWFKFLPVVLNIAPGSA